MSCLACSKVAHFAIGFKRPVTVIRKLEMIGSNAAKPFRKPMLQIKFAADLLRAPTCALHDASSGLTPSYNKATEVVSRAKTETEYCRARP
mmetsp:Transcript_45109/g.125487  ORF Transcript_45109/g.125487 Transcript_45109/m.125487 type:complete len:91 (+) Transcript_45109:97-369(+)